jgi:putative ABC transport system substrate-binding protein
MAKAAPVGSRRRIVSGALAALVVARTHRSLAQPGSAARIGFISCDAGSARMQDAFRLGMRELGLVEGKQFTMQWAFADGDYSRLPAIAAKIVSDGASVIVAVNTLAVQAARRATAKVPLVMIGVPDPVGEGFAVSLSRPGHNVTGLSNIVTEVSVKHVEYLHQALPKLAVVALLINPQNPSDALIQEQVQGAAYTRKVKVFPIEARNSAQIDAAFGAIAKARADAVIVAADAFFDVQREQIVAHTLRNRLPSMFASREITEAGGLMSYGQDLAEHYRRAAGYVDKILKGTPPGVLPIQQPMVIEFVVNLKTAAALGMTLPPQLLLRADKVIE